MEIIKQLLGTKKTKQTHTKKNRNKKKSQKKTTKTIVRTSEKIKHLS